MLWAGLHGELWPGLWPRHLSRPAQALYAAVLCSFFLDSPKKKRTKEKTEAPSPI